MARSDSSDTSQSDSSKKVAKAAKAGATPSSSSGREDNSAGFRAALLGVVVLGTALVAFAWNARDASALQPTFSDHWHIAYGIYDCTIDDFQAHLVDPGFPTHSGIHTHGDSVIHLHPYSSTATGDDATFGRFLEATYASLDGDDALVFDADTGRSALAEGVECDGEEAVLQLARFDPGATEPTDIITEDIGDVRLLGDLEAMTIALAPLGADIPLPPEESLSVAQASSPNIFETSGLESLDDQLEAVGIGFDEEGNLVDANDELILDADGEPITRESLEETGEEGAEEAEAEDAEAEEDADE